MLMGACGMDGSQGRKKERDRRGQAGAFAIPRRIGAEAVSFLVQGGTLAKLVCRDAELVRAVVELIMRDASIALAMHDPAFSALCARICAHPRAQMQPLAVFLTFPLSQGY